MAVTQGSLLPKPSHRDRVAAVLMDAPVGKWIDGLELAKAGGAYAWRTRLSECHTQLGMNYENRQRKVGDHVVSEYRLVPKEAA